MKDGHSDPTVTLSYFDFPGGRGEACRIALHLAGVEFHDDRVKGKDWAEKKPSTPYGGMPVLTIRDKGELAQSNVILGFIGAGHDLLPEDKFEAAQHLAILGSVEDFTARVLAGGFPDEDAKKKARQELAAGYMRDWSNNMSAQISGPFVGGDRISVADLKLYVTVKLLKSGNADYIATDFFDAFPKLTAVHRAVASHPGVVEYEGRA